jgi:hypothetical protein
MVVDKSVDPILSGQLDLGHASLWCPQVIIPKLGRTMGLVVSREARSSLGYIHPIGETFAPPFVIFPSRMELGKIECHKPMRVLCCLRHSAQHLQSVDASLSARQAGHELALLGKLWEQFSVKVMVSIVNIPILAMDFRVGFLTARDFHKPVQFFQVFYNIQ